MNFDAVAEAVKAVKERTGETLIIRTGDHNETTCWIRCEDIQDVDLVFARFLLLIDVRHGPEIAVSTGDITSIDILNRNGWTLKAWDDHVIRRSRP